MESAVAAVAHAELGHGQFSILQTIIMVAESAGFALLMVYVVGPQICRWARHVLRSNRGEITVDALAVLLVLLLGCAIVTNLIGIFAIFGAFILGAVISRETEFCEAVNRRLRDVVTAFFLPIFFTYTGLRTDVRSLESGQLWLLCGAVSAAAIVGKIGGCTLAAWFARFSFREAACVGVMMNTRALMALIVINLGKDLGVVTDSVFCMLVFMAVLTTVMTTPLLLRLMPGTELEAPILRSGFLGAPKASAPAQQIPGGMGHAGLALLASAAGRSAAAARLND
jgi:Kef-type K+ transport system membrane component KefB